MRKSSSVDRKLAQARSLYRQGKTAHSNEDFEEASKSFRDAILIQEVILGKYHQDTIKSYWRCGKSTCLSKTDDRGALQAFQRAARMAETAFEDSINVKLWSEINACWAQTHAESDQALDQISELFVLEQQGDASTKKRHFGKAIEFYQRLLTIQDELVGSDSLDGADIRTKVACCFLHLGKLKEAEHDLHTAHRCFLTHFGEQHPATLGAAAGMKNVKTRGRKDRQGAGLAKKGWLSASLSSLGSTGRRPTARI